MQLNRTIQGDNLNIMKDLDVKFDLILTDPPYNVGKDFGNNTDNLSDEKFYTEIKNRISQAANLLNENGSFILFASYKHVARIQLIMEEFLSFKRLMIWHYKNGMSRQVNSPVTEFEPILWFVKNPNQYTYNSDDVRVPYKSERVKTPVYKKNKNGEKIAWTPNPLGAKRGDVWEYPCLSGKLYEEERTDHPTQKPESLITDLIKAFCPKENNQFTGTVLDPYHGSGTTGICCEKLNTLGSKIKWLGIELERKWVDTAEKRINDLTKNCVF